MKKALLGGFILAILLIAIGVIIGVVSISFNFCGEHGFSAFIHFITSMGKCLV